jgi:hypothetical protein
MNNGTAQERKETRAQFYADDGLLSGENPQEVQRAMDTITNVFARIGLKMNATKTKAMTMVGSKVYFSISKIAYTGRVTGEGHTHPERNLQKVECELCGGMICQQHVVNHQKTRNAREDMRSG